MARLRLLIRVRYFHRYEMEHLVARAAFAVEALYGDLLKNEYTASSPDLIWVAAARNKEPGTRNKAGRR